MKLDTIARSHAEEVHRAAEAALVPPLQREVAGPKTRRLITAVAGAAVVVAAVVVAVVTTAGDDPVTPTTVPVAGTTTTVVPTVADLESAVSAALANLEAAPGIVGTQRAFIGDYLATFIRFQSNEDGSAVVVQQTDLDVLESGWWLATDGAPPAVGERLTTTVFVFVEETLYEGALDDPSGGWIERDGSGIERGPVLALERLALDDPFGLASVEQSAAISGGTLAGDGSLWILITAAGEGEAVQRWEIRSDGSITWSAEAIGATAPVDPRNPFTTTQTEYQPLGAAPFIAPPDGSVPDYLDSLDLPSGLDTTNTTVPPTSDGGT